MRNMILSMCVSCMSASIAMAGVTGVDPEESVAETSGSNLTIFKYAVGVIVVVGVIRIIKRAMDG